MGGLTSGKEMLIGAKLVKVTKRAGGFSQKVTAKPRPQAFASVTIGKIRSPPWKNMAAPIDLTLAKKNLQDAIGEDMRM